MKQLLFILLFTPFLAYAQQKGDSKITVTPSDTTRLYDKLITLLYTEGYTIKVEDKARGIIITEDKTLDKYFNPKVRLTLFVDSLVRITGLVDANIGTSTGTFEMKSSYSPILNKGIKNSIYQNTWKEMERVAKLIGSTLIYSK